MFSRIGQFFLFIGAILCVLFYLSYQEDPTPNETLLGLGIVGIGVGLFLILRQIKVGAPVERFRSVHKVRQRRADTRKKREDARKAKEEARKARKK